MTLEKAVKILDSAGQDPSELTAFEHALMVLVQELAQRVRSLEISTTHPSEAIGTLARAFRGMAQ